MTLEMIYDFRTDIHYRMGAMEGRSDTRFESMLREFKADLAATKIPVETQTAQNQVVLAGYS